MIAISDVFQTFTSSANTIHNSGTPANIVMKIYSVEKMCSRWMKLSGSEILSEGSSLWKPNQLSKLKRFRYVWKNKLILSCRGLFLEYYRKPAQCNSSACGKFCCTKKAKLETQRGVGANLKSIKPPVSAWFPESATTYRAGLNHFLRRVFLLFEILI